MATRRFTIDEANALIPRLEMLMERLQQAAPVRSAAATVMLPASEFGRAAMDELHQQTVNLHPIVTLTAVIVGSQLLGIVGAFLAVPMVAVGRAVYRTLEQHDP